MAYNEEQRKKRNEKRRKQRMARASGIDWIESEAGGRVIRGERAVWRAVILQMLEDATNHSKKPQEKRHRDQALNWLEGTSEDFKIVCDLAGFEPAFVRKKVKQALLNSTRWRKKPNIRPQTIQLKSHKPQEPLLAADILLFPVLHLQSA